jgi:hypothetical protein
MHERIADYAAPLISFVRLGRPKKLQKSEIINWTFFRKSDVFISRSITEIQAKRKVANGLLEATWYCPDDENDRIKDVLTILNLRGDAN